MFEWTVLKFLILPVFNILISFEKVSDWDILIGVGNAFLNSKILRHPESFGPHDVVLIINLNM